MFLMRAFSFASTVTASPPTQSTSTDTYNTSTTSPLPPSLIVADKEKHTHNRHTDYGIDNDYGELKSDADTDTTRQGLRASPPPLLVDDSSPLGDDGGDIDSDDNDGFERMTTIHPLTSSSTTSSSSTNTFTPFTTAKSPAPPATIAAAVAAQRQATQSALMMRRHHKRTATTAGTQSDPGLNRRAAVGVSVVTRSISSSLSSALAPSITPVNTVATPSSPLHRLVVDLTRTDKSIVNQLLDHAMRIHNENKEKWPLPGTHKGMYTTIKSVATPTIIGTIYAGVRSASRRRATTATNSAISTPTNRSHHQSSMPHSSQPIHTPFFPPTSAQARQPASASVPGVRNSFNRHHEHKQHNSSRRSGTFSTTHNAQGSLSPLPQPNSASQSQSPTPIPLSPVSSPPQIREPSMVEVGEACLNNSLHRVYACCISYPGSWCPPAEMPLSPYHNTEEQSGSEAEIISWCLSRLGADMVTKEIRDRLMALESAKWAAFLAPLASDEYITHLGCFLAIFVIIDDQLVEEADKLKLAAQDLRSFSLAWKYAAHRKRNQMTESEQVKQEVAELSEKLHNPLIAACYDALVSLSDDYANCGADEDWCARMSSAWEEYIELGIREAIAAERINQASVHAQGSTQPLPAIVIPLTKYDHPSIHATAQANNGAIENMQILEILGRQRIASIGLPMMVLQLERICGLLLSQSIAQLIAPSVQILALLPALVNELVGLARDLKGGDTLISANFSLVQRRLCLCPLAESIDFTLAFHSAAVSAFDYAAEQIEQKLKPTTDTRTEEAIASEKKIAARMKVFLTRLRQMVRGYAHWHHHAARYKSVIAVDAQEQQMFIFPVHDGAKQKEEAILDTLDQYKTHARRLTHQNQTYTQQLQQQVNQSILSLATQQQQQQQEQQQQRQQHQNLQNSFMSVSSPSFHSQPSPRRNGNDAHTPVPMVTEEVSTEEFE